MSLSPTKNPCLEYVNITPSRIKEMQSYYSNCDSTGEIGKLSLFCLLEGKKKKRKTTSVGWSRHLDFKLRFNLCWEAYCSWKSMDWEGSMEELSPYLHPTALFPVVKHYQIPTSGNCHTSIAKREVWLPLQHESDCNSYSLQNEFKWLLSTTVLYLCHWGKTIRFW